MGKIRINKLALELNIQNDQILDALIVGNGGGNCAQINIKVTKERVRKSMAPNEH